MRQVWIAILLSLGVFACSNADDGLSAEALAKVGEVELTLDDVAQTQTQLGAYAQRRFRGPEGQRHLVDALVDAEVLAWTARRAGLDDDPRVRHAVLEEIARLQLDAELEHRVPFASVAQDRAALERVYRQRLASFTLPERRSAKGVVFLDFARAEHALAQLQSGAVKLEALGEVVSTPLLPRDDHEFPGFHPWLFAKDASVGDLFPRPLVLGQTLLVGCVERIEPARVQGFDDEQVQAELVRSLREPRLRAARKALLDALAERFPVDAR